MLYLWVMILDAFAKLRKRLLDRQVGLPACNNSAPTGRIFMKFYILGIFWKSVENVQVSLKYDKNKGYFILTATYVYYNMSLT
jgi:hypothetical protein